MTSSPFGKVLDARKARPALPPNPDYGAPPLTVECLARLSSAREFHILVANEPKSSATHWELYSYASSGVLSVYMPGYAPAEVKSSVVVTDGEWHYCAMTFDGRVVRLFVDGKRVQSERVRRVAAMTAAPGPLCVGHIAGTGLGCDGLLDEVRVSSVIRAITGVPTAPFQDDADTLALWHFDPEFAGTGVSAWTDPFRAGAEAALKARKALGGGEARVVIVFDRLDGEAEAGRKLIEGIGWFFDTSLVCGCNGFGPITNESNAGTVGVLALGEAVEVVTACAEVAGDHEACGRKLGASLKSASKPNAPGSLALLLGDCHVPANDALVRGFTAGFASPVPVVGGSCPQNGRIYDRGTVKQGVNLALLISGDFRVRAALGQAANPDQIASSAGAIVERAIGGDRGNLALALVFDCVSRKQAAGEGIASELEAMRRAVPSGALVFGFYGSGEIGAEGPEQAPRGVGAHLAVAALCR